MLKIAVTGNIASGKSEAEKIIKNSGYKTICADELSHLALSDTDIKNQILDIFHTTKREELGQIVFSDKKKKKELEKIIHPFVIEKINEFFINNKEEKLLFAFIPLLFEANLQKEFDKIIFIYSDDNLRLDRLIKFRSYKKEYALLRMNSQMNQATKKDLSDYVVLNNSDINSLKIQLNEIINKLEEH